MGCMSSAILPTSEYISDLDGIGTLELKKLLKKLRDSKSENVQRDIKELKRHKPVTNYKLERIPCTKKCKRNHKRPHYQFVQLADPKYSLLTIAAHLKAASITENCTLWLTCIQQERVDRLYEDLKSTNRIS